jgi:hypothetical protein
MSFDAYLVTNIYRPNTDKALHNIMLYDSKKFSRKWLTSPCHKASKDV